MLKISRSESIEPTVTLRLEGRIVGPWVDELRQAGKAVLGEGHVLRLHLADVAFMDPAGVLLLGELQSQGAVLVAAPPFIAAQLKVVAGTVGYRR